MPKNVNYKKVRGGTLYAWLEDSLKSDLYTGVSKYVYELLDIIYSKEVYDYLTDNQKYFVAIIASFAILQPPQKDEEFVDIANRARIAARLPDFSIESQDHSYKFAFILVSTYQVRHPKI